MKTKNTIKYIVTLALFVVIAVPAYASAATVYLEASRASVSVGDTIVVAVKADANGAVLNTIDGSVVLKASNGAAQSVQEFSLANSILGLWPRTPSLSTDGNTISFIGGVPGGFSIEGATLFKIVIQATKPGTITINPQNMSVFANDGNATKVPVQTKALTITVAAKQAQTPVVNDWSGIVAQDTTPPEDFIVVPGQDASLFSGKKFAFFSAVDNQSGIDHYDVVENGGAVIRSGSMYVFQDQVGNPKLVVTAYDKAGNKKISYYPAQQPEKGIAWIPVIVVVVIIVLGYFIFKRMTKRNTTNASSTL